MTTGEKSRMPATSSVGDRVDTSRPSETGSVLSERSEALVHDLEELGLNGSEARVLLALMQLGVANSIDLARLSKVPRTSVYPILEHLTGKRLAARVPGEGTAKWVAAGRDQVVERLQAAHDERVREHTSRLARVRDSLEQAFPASPRVTLSHVQLIRGVAQAQGAYERLLSEAVAEVLVFNRPPYGGPIDAPNDVVLGTRARGVEIRVLYEDSHLDQPGSERFRSVQEAYLDAGVQARVVDELPIKLAIFDRAVALIAMTDDPAAPEAGFPTNLLVEHRGFATIQAEVFDLRWNDARPYPRSSTDRSAGKTARPARKAHRR